MDGTELRERDESLWANLALLRFFLAMVVVVGHCCSFVGGPADWTFIGLWLNQGSAVFGFFIISGYSIAASLEKSPAGYYRRRVVRIWPLYLACIATALMVSLRIPNGMTWPTGSQLAPTRFAAVAASLFMLQTIAGPAIPVVGQIWSLSSEWWLYMTAPALRRVSTLALCTLLGASFAAFMSIATPPGAGPEGFNYGLATLTLAWLWLTGFAYRRLDRQPTGAALLVMPSVYAMFLGHFTGAPLFITIFVLLLSGDLRMSSRCRRFCGVLGDLSFPLYLFHIPAMVLLLTLGVRDTAILVAASVVAAGAALWGIDYPSRRLLRATPRSDAAARSVAAVEQGVL